MLATRQWFADNALACIDEVERGDVKVNDRDSYFSWRRQDHADALAGKFDGSLAFLQRAWFMQTGESIPLLPI